MRKIEAFYSALIAEIANICDDDNKMENYWNELEATKRNEIDALSELLLAEKQKLKKCRRDLEIYEDLALLKGHLGDFNSSFSDYPDFNYSKVNFIIYLLDKILLNSSEIPDENIGIEFSGIKVELEFQEKAYITNLNDLEKSLAWFSPCSEESLNKLISYDTDVNCWYALLALVNDIDFNTNSEYLFCSKCHFDADVPTDNLKALLKIHMASAGMKTTPSIEYNRSPSNSSIELFCPTQSYSQFSDVIGILGEYNNRNDILAKYLSIFHVIENFMFKEPIVQLERATTGSMFSIRDFKRLYKSVDKDESKALKNLFKTTFDMVFSTLTFKDFVFKNWEDFLAAHIAKQPEIDGFLCSLGVNDLDNVSKNNFYDFIARVVYQVRCSIVHNKETEFHISTESYPEGCKLLLENYLLEFLEELVFLLLREENSIVWYTSDSIKLWDATA